MMKLEHLGESLLSSAAFAALGIVVFTLAFWLITKLTPFSIIKEIEHDQNTALAVLVASVIIGLALIVSAAIIG
jgi:putative membrane protein